MNAIILAGGNQTRFGVSLQVQPKVLYPLSDGTTLLSHTIRELDTLGLHTIIICIADKENLGRYIIEEIQPRYTTTIVVNTLALPDLGAYVFRLQEHYPATFIFGDVYFPKGSLGAYFKKAAAGSKKYDAFIGVTPKRVGDFRVNIVDGLVTEISKELTDGYYTCGLFTLYDNRALKNIEPTEKLTEIFAQLPSKRYKLGCSLLDYPILDLDTQDIAHELPR